MKAAWWSYKNQSMEETLLNRQKTGMVESNELTLEKKIESGSKSVSTTSWWDGIYQFALCLEIAFSYS